ncbi:hypothetical protein AGMMS50230_21210 [Spirochaetia bacterium]|nr:hypothetical protein AGMMS50230_21210 [Spirochaetia bacterium]
MGDKGTPMRAVGCNSLTTGGYTDWFLPSKGELAAMITESATIGGFAVIDSYWSSSQGTNNYLAWVDGLISGNPGWQP